MAASELALVIEQAALSTGAYAMHSVAHVMCIEEHSAPLFARILYRETELPQVYGRFK